MGRFEFGIQKHWNAQPYINRVGQRSVRHFGRKMRISSFVAVSMSRCTCSIHEIGWMNGFVSMNNAAGISNVHITCTVAAKPLKEKPDDLKWAVVELTDAQQLISLEKKVNRKTARKVRRGELSKLSDGLRDVALNEKTNESIKPIVNMELNHTTVLYLSHKEFNKKGIEILQDLILEEDDQPNQSLHRLLFSGKDEAKQLLDIERKHFEFAEWLVKNNFLKKKFFSVQNHKDSTTDSIGHMFIPQLNFNLETEIDELIATKKLMPQHVSLAPMISFA